MLLRLQPGRPHIERWGALVLELALVLPFLVFVVLVVLDFCRLYQVTQTLTASASVGAYYASGAGQPPAYQPPSGGLLPPVTLLLGSLLGGQPPAQTDPSVVNLAAAARKAAIAESASLQPPLSDDQVTVSYQNNTASVTVTYTAELITPIFGSRTVPISRTVTMVVIGYVP